MKRPLLYLLLMTTLCQKAGADTCCQDQSKPLEILKEFASNVNPSLWLSQGFYKVGLQCPERIWPKLSFANKDLLFVDPKSHQSVQLNLNASTVSISTIPTQQLLDQPQGQADFVFSRKGKRDALSVLIKRGASVSGDPLQNAFMLAFHEGFHIYYQLNEKHKWPLYIENTSRNEFYPEDWRPLYYRNQVIRLLKEGFYNESIQTEKLCEAKYWQDKLIKEFPNRAALIKSNDIDEGTASYVDRKALQIATHPKGCGATNQELESVELRENRDVLVLSIDSQSYPLGEYSGFLLDRIDSSGKWKNTVMQGFTPVEILFSKITNCPSRTYPDDPIARSKLRENISLRNAENRAKIEPLIDKWNSSEFARVAIPSKLIQGSMYLQSSYSVSAIKDGAVDNQVSMQLRGSGIEVQLKDAMVISTETTDNPCKEFSKIILVPRSSLSRGAIILNSPESSGKITKFKRVDSKGKAWICAAEN